MDIILPDVYFDGIQYVDDFVARGFAQYTTDVELGSSSLFTSVNNEGTVISVAPEGMEIAIGFYEIKVTLASL